MKRVSLPVKLLFGFGQLTEGIQSFAFTAFLLFYYNQALGLDAFYAGLAVFIATFADAITDPMVGSLSDGFRHRWGRRHPFLYASILPLAVSFALVFNPPDGLGPLGLFLWLLFFAIAVRTSMTFFNVPYMALGAELSSDYNERTEIVAYRNAFSVVGVGIVIAVAFGHFFRATPEFAYGQLNPGAYPGFGLLFGCVMAASILVSAVGTHPAIPRLSRPASSMDRFRVRGVVEDFRRALAVRSFRVLFIGIVIFFVVRGIQDSLMLHMGTFFWELSPSEMQAFSLAFIPGILLGIPVWTVASRRLDKMPTFVIGIALLSAATMIPPLLKIWGWFPDAEHPAYLPSLAVLVCIAAFGVAAALVVSGSMLADVADEHELLTGRRQEGIFFAALSFAAKATSGLGQFVGGSILRLIRFPSAAEPGAVPPETVTALGVAFGPGVALLAAGSIYFVSRYSLDKARHAEIRAELSKRPAESDEGSSG